MARHRRILLGAAAVRSRHRRTFFIYAFLVTTLLVVTILAGTANDAVGTATTSGFTATR